MNKLLMISALVLTSAASICGTVLMTRHEPIPAQQLNIGQKFELSAVGVTVEVTGTELWRMYTVKDSNGGEGFIEQDELLKVVEELK